MIRKCDMINEIIITDKCKKGETECLNGGYAHPSNCKICICPNGFSGKKCEKNEKPLGLSFFFL